MPRPRQPSLIELEQRKPSRDPRVTHRGRYNAWLWKVKSDTSMTKWLKESTSRVFTIDFDQQIFYYSHSKGTMNMSHLVPFRSILGAEQHPPSFGFSVETRDRIYMLYSTSNADAALWVAAVKAAHDLGKLETRRLENKIGSSFWTGVRSITEAAHTEKKSDDGKPAEQADGQEEHPKEEEPDAMESEATSCNFENTSDVSTCDEMPVTHSRKSGISTSAPGGPEDGPELPRSGRSYSSDSNNGHAQQQATTATAPATGDFDREEPEADSCDSNDGHAQKQAAKASAQAKPYSFVIKIITEGLC